MKIPRVSLLFGCWFVLIAANQFATVREKLAHPLYSLFLPSWTFFAPQPAATDYRILTRDWTTLEGPPGPWHVLDTVAPRPWYAFLVNRRQRFEKAVFDMGQELRIQGSDDRNRGSEQELSSYQMFAQYILSAVSREPEAMYTQFMVVQDPGHSTETVEPTVVFISAIHRLDSA